MRLPARTATGTSSPAAIPVGYAAALTAVPDAARCCFRPKGGSPWSVFIKGARYACAETSRSSLSKESDQPSR